MKKLLPLLCFALICSHLTAQSQNLLTNTENLTPVINKSDSSLTGFAYTFGAGPSSQQSFTISGSNLTNGIIITAPANYEISAYSRTSFIGTRSLTITQSGGLVSPLTLYVRLKAGLAANAYSGNITLASAAITQAIALSGSVAAPPVIITPSVTALSGFTYIERSGPSAQLSFTVRGINLTGGITITAPANYEISVLSGTSFSGTGSITIAQSAGIVPSTTIFVRIKSGLTAGAYTGNITLASTGATAQTIALTGTVRAPGITISASSLTDFSYFQGSGPSAIQSFTISGASLTSFVIVTAPDNFEISSESGAYFLATGQVLLVPANGTVAATAIYVRLMSGLPVSFYNENISITSTGSATKTVSLAGNVLLTTANPGLAGDAITAYTYGGDIIVQGTAKDELISLYTITGMRLKTVKSGGERVVIAAQQGAVYLIKTASKVVKIIL